MRLGSIRPVRAFVGSALALSVAALADRYWSAAALLACVPLAFAGVRGDHGGAPVESS